MTVPIKVINLDAFVSRVLQVVTTEQNLVSLYKTPTTLQMQGHVAHFDLLAIAVTIRCLGPNSKIYMERALANNRRSVAQ